MMKAMIRLAVAVLASMVCMCAVAQEMIGTNDTQVIPPTPSTAIFKRYMGEQPSLATGSVNVNVPIYTIECHGLTIPLSMRYNTSGIKVFDDPFPCGLGWALLPGLRVMRTILGRPDELFEYKGDMQNLGDDFMTTQRCMTMSGLAAGMGGENKYDSEHDLFTVCLTDATYSFILEKDGDNGCNFKGSGCSEIKIFADKDLNEITVVDSHGIRYFFGGARETTDMSYVTSWMLTRIELTNGEEIKFEWIFENHRPGVGVLVPDRYVDNLEPNTLMVYNSQNLNNPLDGTVENLSPYKMFCNLKKITFPGGTVEMEYESFLKKIKVSHGSSVVKTATLSYDKAGNGYERVLTRLSLSDEGDYTFGYNSQKFDNPYAQDYWGYYNGADNVASLGPKLRRKFYKTDGYIEMGYADRNVNAEMMKANILTSVTYPTGGYTEYEYEPHRFKDPHVFFDSYIHPDDNKPLTEGGGIRVVKIKNQGKGGTVPVVKRYVYGVAENGLAECLATPIPETFVSRYSVVVFDTTAGVLPPPAIDYDIVSISNASNYLNNNYNVNNIWYKEVTEYIEGSDEYGKIVYKFDEAVRQNDMKGDEYGSPVMIGFYKAFSPEILKVSETVYSVEGGKETVKLCNSWVYSVINRQSLTASTKIIRRYYSNYNNSDTPDFGEDGSILVEVDTKNPFFPIREFRLSCADKEVYKTWLYSVNFDKSRLVSKRTTVYSDNGERTISRNYDYLDDSCIPSRLTTVVNGETSEILDLYYPHTTAEVKDGMTDYQSQASVYAAMTSANILAVPVFTVLTKGRSKMSAQTLLKHYGASLYLPEKVLARRGTGAFSVLGTYDYDKSGNLAARTSATGLAETFLWAYYGRYPVFHIPGFDYSQVKAIVGENVDIYSWPYSSYAAVNNVRDTFLSKSLLSEFNFKESVGLSTCIEPAGLTTSYEYDAMNRLSAVNSSGRHHMSEMAYQLSREDFSVSVNSEKSVYKAGEQVWLKSSVENGSQRLSYQWHIIGQDGKELAVVNAKSPQLREAIDGYGPMTATCIVTDELKGVSVSGSVTFTVSPQNICFTDISGSEESVSANLYCAYALKVTFKVMLGVEPDAFEILIDGMDYSNMVAYGEQFSVNLSSGRHSVELRFTDNEAVGDVIFYILKVEGTHGETCDHEPIVISRLNRMNADENDTEVDAEKSITIESATE